ncbi:MAG: ABC transporter permease [Bacilli bacterium]|nr:ABC transporter permease [Bacilli bacterium]
MPEKMTAKKEKSKLFHVEKRFDMPLWQSILIRFGFIIVALFIGLLILTISYGVNPFDAIGSMFVGSFGTEKRIWDFLRDGVLLLGVGLALIPSFKMKFWNLGGNGQIIIGALVSVILMINLGGKYPDAVVLLIMIPSAILAGAVWAAIPAIFKALFNTNESLFTLMMNYVSVGLVNAFIMAKYPIGSHVIPRIDDAHFPSLYNGSLLIIIIIAVLLGGMVYYLKFSKHGYELSVVGESMNTARYVGINVKKVIIRTIIVSGALCGFIGCLLASGVDFTVTPETGNNMGFTAIMAVWLAKFNPIIAAGTSFFIVFITRGMTKVQSDNNIMNDATPNLIIGLIYFFIIGCEFFVEYKLLINKGGKEMKITEFIKSLFTSKVEKVKLPPEAEAAVEEEEVK